MVEAQIDVETLHQKNAHAFLRVSIRENIIACSMIASRGPTKDNDVRIKLCSLLNFLTILNYSHDNILIHVFAVNGCSAID